MVIASTAIPVEWRGTGRNAFDFRSVYWLDALTNIAGYLPVGIAFAWLSPLRAVLSALSLSAATETAQMWLVNRDPSLADIVCNTAGAAVGYTMARLAARREVRIPVTRWTCAAAALLALADAAWMRQVAGDAINQRGWRQPGVLEAKWSFDEPQGSVAMDMSGRGRNGSLTGRVTRAEGVSGRALQLDGGRGYVDAGHSTAFREAGSLTLTAWIRSSTYPRDDAAIVSTLSAPAASPAAGFQLDTTIDTGPRTVGFKLSNGCGEMMARYGATPLAIGRWYHVAGVYNAAARSLDVYLDGRNDNGRLVGSIGGRQRPSREHLMIGRRSDLTGYPFSGLLDDVAIYSRPLTADEIAALAARDTAAPAPGATAGNAPPDLSSAGVEDCDWSSDRQDARLPAPVVVLGILVAFVGAGLAIPRYVILAAAAGVGLLAYGIAGSDLPRLDLLTFSLVSAAGALSVLWSSERAESSDAASSQRPMDRPVGP